MRKKLLGLPVHLPSAHHAFPGGGGKDGNAGIPAHHAHQDMAGGSGKILLRIRRMLQFPHISGMMKTRPPGKTHSPFPPNSAA